jgi:hypothetical protein
LYCKIRKGSTSLKERMDNLMLKITADMFSGRENPTWLAGAEEATKLLQQIGQNRSAIGELSAGFQGLGYRGLIVEALSDNVADKYDLPPVFRLAHTAHSTGLEIADQVFSSMLRAQTLDKDAHGLVTRELQRLGSREDASEQDAPQTAPPTPSAKATKGASLVTCWIELGHFNPGFWNDPAHITRNNCYNYASNWRTDTFAQPGRGTGHQATVMACPDVTNGALSDGCHRRFDCFPDSERPRWLMALVVAPGYDYHWYRKQQEGFWGHKPGGTAARNFDNNGAIVWNPETAARLPYTNFCGYFYGCQTQRSRIR